MKRVVLVILVMLIGAMIWHDIAFEQHHIGAADE